MNQQQLIERIHARAKPLVIAVTGGGSGAIAAILGVPGASNTVLEAVVPYAAKALTEWLGGPPDHYCSERTARAMAMAAFERARKLSDADPYTLRGIGATASLASNRPKRGPHRVHVAWQSAESTGVLSCEFDKGMRTRAQEEEAASAILIRAIALACGIRPDEKLEFDGRPLIDRETRVGSTWSELLLGQRYFDAFPELKTSAVPKVVFPGSFNPIHAGHKRIAEIAAAKFGAPVTFEVSITNVDKPPLDFIELEDRILQLMKLPYIFTRAPRFVDKAKLLPGCTFVVGVDTIIRLDDPKYYNDSVTERNAAIAAIAAAGCRFLVFGRVVDGVFRTLSDVSGSSALLSLCDEVPGSEFREDISSTELRSE